MMLPKFLGKWLHKHHPKFDGYERAFVGYPNQLSARWAMYICTECGIKGHREEWPQEDVSIHWYDK